MIMETLIKNRLEQLRNMFFAKQIDTLMVLIEENRRYLSGFTGEDTQFDESAGALFISSDKLILATDSRFELQAKKEASLFDVFCYKDGLAESLPEILDLLKVKKLGFESTRLSHSQYMRICDALAARKSQIELFGFETFVEDLRLKKGNDEVEAIKNSLSIAESAFQHFLKHLSPNMTEREAAWKMEQEIREAGADSLSFPTIAASGPNSALPHAIPGKRRFKNGEPLLFDWGAKLNGYCSDISRTVVIGQADETYRKVYTTVQDAQKFAMDKVRPGINGKTVDGIARNHIESKGYKGKFGHGLGHGVGLAVHELPRISPLKDAMLEPGMVFTVEPGIYLPDWGGIRIENMVIVREHGAEALNEIDTDMIII
jgi:Xaa-Pro aminopeptidase